MRAKDVRLWVSELNNQITGLRASVQSRTHEEGSGNKFWEDIEMCTRSASAGETQCLKWKLQAMNYQKLRADVSVLSQILMRAQTFLRDGDVYNNVSHDAPQLAQRLDEIEEALEYTGNVWQPQETASKVAQDFTELHSLEACRRSSQ